LIDLPPLAATCRGPARWWAALVADCRVVGLEKRPWATLAASGRATLVDLPPLAATCRGPARWRAALAADCPMVGLESRPWAALAASGRATLAALPPLAATGSGPEAGGLGTSRHTPLDKELAVVHFLLHCQVVHFLLQCCQVVHFLLPVWEKGQLEDPLTAVMAGRPLPAALPGGGPPPASLPARRSAACCCRLPGFPPPVC
jgi:hypothetical protein